MTISFKEKELAAMRKAIEGYLDTMENSADTCDSIDEILDNGLGSALYKLYKGKEGERFYKKYVKGKCDESV